jgi:hypothetical protein
MSIDLADLDGDSDIDLAVSLIGYVPGGSVEDYDLVAVLFNSGSGSFSERLDAQSNPIRFPVGNNARSIFLADLREDGNTDVDIVTANDASNSISVLYNDGLGNFSLSTNYSIGSRTYSVFVADLNGDGYNDVAATNRNDDNVSVLLNDGTGSFNSPSNVTVGDGPVDVFLENVTGDSSKDIIVLNRYDSSVEIQENDGTGSFTFKAEYNVHNYNYSSLLVGDADLDGYKDILLTGVDANLVTIMYYNVTASSYSPQDRVEIPISGGPESLVLADLEVGRAGYVNIATANVQAATITILVSDVPPTISLIEPDGVDDTVRFEFRIEWEDSDPDSDATIHLFYYPSGSPTESELLGTFMEDDENDYFVWNVSLIDGGDYYIEAVISDDFSVEAVTSSGPLTVEKETPPDGDGDDGAEVTPGVIVVAIVGTVLTVVTLLVLFWKREKPPEE